MTHKSAVFKFVIWKTVAATLSPTIDQVRAKQAVATTPAITDKRELGPLPEGVPDFPLASAAARPLALKAETNASPDFTQLYAGQAVTLSGGSCSGVDFETRSSGAGETG